MEEKNAYTNIHKKNNYHNKGLCQVAWNQDIYRKEPRIASAGGAGKSESFSEAR